MPVAYNIIHKACKQALYGSVYVMMATIKGTADSVWVPKGHSRISDNIIIMLSCLNMSNKP